MLLQLTMSMQSPILKQKRFAPRSHEHSRQAMIFKCVIAVVAVTEVDTAVEAGRADTADTAESPPPERRRVKRQLKHQGVVTNLQECLERAEDQRDRMVMEVVVVGLE